ncbi:hypothetical protein L7F22_052476 [Adiantum nelumboides]|nr:hypothetical protein [Adiantum nelumboides]
MAQHNQGNKINIDNLNLAHHVAIDEGQRIVNYLVGKLSKAMGNPTLQAKVQGQIQQLQLHSNAQEEKALQKPPNETSKKETFLGNEEEMHVESPQQSAKDSAVHQELSKERDGSELPLLVKLKGERPEGMDKDDWEELDELACFTIMLTLAKNVYFNVAKETTTYGVWQKLCDMYEKQSATSHIYWLKKLVDLKMKKGTVMSNHLNEFRTIFSQLRA